MRLFVTEEFSSLPVQTQESIRSKAPAEPTQYTPVSLGNSFEVSTDTDASFTVYELSYDSHPSSICIEYMYRDEGTRTDSFYFFPTTTALNTYINENIGKLSEIERLHLIDTLLLTGGKLSSDEPAYKSEFEYNTLSFSLLTGLTSLTTMSELFSTPTTVFENDGHTIHIETLLGENIAITGDKNRKKGVLAHQLAQRVHELAEIPWFVFDITSYTTGLQAIRETHTGKIEDIAQYIGSEYELTSVPFVGKEQFGVTQHLADAISYLESVTQPVVVSVSGQLSPEADLFTVENENVTFIQSTRQDSVTPTEEIPVVIRDTLEKSEEFYDECRSSLRKKLKNGEDTFTVAIGDDQVLWDGRPVLVETVTTEEVEYTHKPTVFEVLSIHDSPRVSVRSEVVEDVFSEGGPCRYKED